MRKFFLIVSTTAMLLVTVVKNCDAVTENITSAIDTGMSIYYNPNTKSTLKIDTVGSSKKPSLPIRFVSRGLPCSCNNLKCGCCAGMNITTINFDRRACANITIVPEEFAMDFGLIVDNYEVYKNRVTGRNPPPACVPLYFFPAITFCVRFFDLHFIDNRFNVCIDFETKVASLPLFILHFNCLGLSGSGVTWENPENEVVKPIVANASDAEVYDHVNFELSDGAAYLHTSTLTPEEEDQIGTLKLK